MWKLYQLVSLSKCSCKEWKGWWGCVRHQTKDEPFVSVYLSRTRLGQEKHRFHKPSKLSQSNSNGGKEGPEIDTLPIALTRSYKPHARTGQHSIPERLLHNHHSHQLQLSQPFNPSSLHLPLNPWWPIRNWDLHKRSRPTYFLSKCTLLWSFPELPG